MCSEASSITCWTRAISENLMNRSKKQQPGSDSQAQLKKSLTSETFDEAIVHLLTGENATCFECNQQSLWASVSLGIFLCIVHAGQHRHLGTHLSKVRIRSLTLDSWDQKQVLFLELGGNHRAAQVFQDCQAMSLQQKYSTKTADIYRNKLRQDVGDRLGIELQDENKPIALDPALQKFANAKSIGSSDFQPKPKREAGPCDCCTIF